MLSNDVLILREAIGKLTKKLEENEEITADETNALVEASNKCVGTIHKINAMKPEGPTEESQFAQAEYECFRNVHKLLKETMAKPGRYPDGKEVVRKLRLAHPDLFCPPTTVEPRRSTILAAAEARVAALAHAYREQGEEREPTTLSVTLRTRTDLVPMWMMRMRGLTEEASTPMPRSEDVDDSGSEDVDDSGSEGVDGSGSEVGSVVSDEMDSD
ncbi:hypothetical protein GE21DRAFT_6986 [Neurospora crassa]|uniref:Uncharacterized protein n=1 Tax=Neurospora crassa (strain ATCC 24698 / 74-OR23-1A / CBS 708.71 / DSM 1257 / FGSC 987) TaxID=367110 RepID=Q7S2G9_NEUCR|nr:hypothetical protein NCU08884 [Neurospora crassa OR74A]EAA29586.1 hypothetical protein NCU08884 [Neurospora crassa OR74A]KHE81080.1 hypothetical protein GE21DRAFT_6986 [Neurospora crassa]|eukprot:XP_958822.1 hypothetical protein NCU08884 [Neurospora crassa OR74A]